MTQTPADKLMKLGSQRDNAEQAASSTAEPRHVQAERFQAEERRKQSGLAGVVNGKPLSILNWMTSVLLSPPSLHRLMNAGFFSLGLFGGKKLADTMAARELVTGAHLNDVSKIWAPLRPLHGIAMYRKQSSVPMDRWFKAGHAIVPIAFGLVGTYFGSWLFFRDNYNKAKKAEYLEDYTDRILLHESETYAETMAATSIFSTSAGVHMLPVVSYAGNLQNRFMMGNGQQVATPILNQVWSGNPSNYPWHIHKLLDFMIEYATYNPSEFPREFPDLAHAIVAKLYPDLPKNEMKQYEDRFVDAIYAVRDKYYKKGGIPKLEQDAFHAEMKQRFRGEGLEITLDSIGLDPAKADLDHNGLGATFAHWSGAAGKIKHDVTEYRMKALHRRDERHKKEQEAPQSMQADTPSTTISAPTVAHAAKAQQSAQELNSPTLH